MDKSTIYFEGPRHVAVRVEPLLLPGEGEVLVQTELSAISTGTEMLLYRGEMPQGLDAGADRISSGLSYPTPYGYAAVGRIVQLGDSVERSWLNRRVFGFRPHTSHFLAKPASLLKLPADLGAEQAVFLPSAETAVNLVQDAAPILGECAVVLGQGVVGLLTAALLHEFPLKGLVAVDRFDVRRKASEGIGVNAALDPDAVDFRQTARSFTGKHQRGFDLAVEISGSPSALDDAIALTTFGGRVILGSWFGMKQVPLELGTSFHRSRIRIVSSQVSTIAPELSGRWDRERRFEVAWDAIRRLKPMQWITHRFPIEQAADAYQLLDQSPAEAIQAVLQYS